MHSSVATYTVAASLAFDPAIAFATKHERIDYLEIFSWNKLLHGYKII